MGAGSSAAARTVCGDPHGAFSGYGKKRCLSERVRRQRGGQNAAELIDQREQALALGFQFPVQIEHRIARRFTAGFCDLAADIVCTRLHGTVAMGQYSK